MLFPSCFCCFSANVQSQRLDPGPERWARLRLPLNLRHGVVFSFLIRALLKVFACVNMILFIVFLISAFIVLPYFHAEAIKIF